MTDQVFNRMIAEIEAGSVATLIVKDMVTVRARLSESQLLCLYLQYFIGMREHGRCPFGASMLAAFRKRFSEKDLAAVLEASVPKAETWKKEDLDDGNNPHNRGTPALDVACCPADIACPRDIDLLHQAGENAEKPVDELCEMTGRNPGCTASVPGRTISVCPEAGNAVGRRSVQRYANSCNTSAGT